MGDIDQLREVGEDWKKKNRREVGTEIEAPKFVRSTTRRPLIGFNVPPPSGRPNPLLHRPASVAVCVRPRDFTPEEIAAKEKAALEKATRERYWDNRKRNKEARDRAAESESISEEGE